ncbi:MAG: SIS domain-containing protein [Chloroflexota bacterium]|nr:SIS domain-containing protein [Chloroflexota bacterium]
MTNHKTWIVNYLATLENVIERFPVDDLSGLISIIENVRENEKTLFICGNGGSWATAAHMVCDLGKNTRMQGSKRMRVIGLGDNIPSLTAYANDEGYDRVFAEPLISLMQPDDVLLAISGSGNSPNILRAVEAANAIGGTTLGLTGFNGGKMKELVDHCLVIPSNSMEMVEDFHIIVDHILTTCLRDE